MEENNHLFNDVSLPLKPPRTGIPKRKSPQVEIADKTPPTLHKKPKAADPKKDEVSGYLNIVEY